VDNERRSHVAGSMALRGGGVVHLLRKETRKSVLYRATLASLMSVILAAARS
jgi:hypothetical protein